MSTIYNHYGANGDKIIGKCVRNAFNEFNTPSTMAQIQSGVLQVAGAVS